MSNFTHYGSLVGDARNGFKRRKVMLRETKNYWITEEGYKYRKTTGWPAGNNDWPYWTLDVKTVSERSANDKG